MATPISISSSDYNKGEVTEITSNTGRRLNRAAWHRPLVSVIITHHDYSDHIEGALLSLLDQTHANWECVVVDDASTPQHREALEAIVTAIGSPKIRVITLDENVGQIPAFFAGLEQSSGDFVCLLDPDDRYAEAFLAEALAAHLNDALYCPVVCTDQFLLSEQGLLTRVYTWHKRRFLDYRDGGVVIIPEAIPSKLLFFSAAQPGWHWTSTSAMMFRRAALNFLRPHKTLGYKGSADSYLVNGVHMMGGSLLLTQPLVYRLVHDDNAYLSKAVFASGQNKSKINGEERTAECIVDVIEAIIANGGAEYLPPPPPQPKPEPQPEIIAEPLFVEPVPKKKKKKKTFSRRMRRSIRKRINRVLGRSESQ